MICIAGFDCGCSYVPIDNLIHKNIDLLKYLLVKFYLLAVYMELTCGKRGKPTSVYVFVSYRCRILYRFASTISFNRRSAVPGEVLGVDAARVRGTAHKNDQDDAGRRGGLQN